jgi:hypothetical protein
MPCSDRAVLLKATAQHVRRETACGLRARVRLLPATTRSSTKVVTRSIPIADVGGHCESKQRLSWTRKRVVAADYKKDDLLNYWTSSSDISGNHADFREGHGTIGAWHAWINGTAWQGNGMGAAWAWHATCESAFNDSWMDRMQADDSTVVCSERAVCDINKSQAYWNTRVVFSSVVRAFCWYVVVFLSQVLLPFSFQQHCCAQALGSIGHASYSYSEGPSSDLGRDTDYPELRFLQSLQAKRLKGAPVRAI